MVERAQIIVKGVVQGVGFRPYVFNLAGALNLKGQVTNTSEGVFIDVEGTGVSEFIRRLKSEAPPLSQITDISVIPLPVHGYLDFSIKKSTDQTGNLPFTLISPDVSICDDCLRELLDPADRRFRYPFINCTNCGPRYSITRSIPYDRPNTTMAGFTLCHGCLKEYNDPRDRRFHAQPNACPVCGPQVEFRVRSSEFGVAPHPDPLPDGAREKKDVPLPPGERIKVRGEALKASIELLLDGGIVAIKGIGGFHIACDATNDRPVKRLREKKRKSNKPFAVMAPSIEAAQQFCMISEDEKKLLLSSRRPVVLLRKRPGCLLSDFVSPNNQFIGVMLPYTPLHYLLFYHPTNENPPHSPFSKGGGNNNPPLAKGGVGGFETTAQFKALVMTSGNLSEEPIVRDNDEAVQKLAGIVDGFLLHNRDIFMRVDDSVIRISDFGFRILDCKSSGHGTSSSDGKTQSAIRNPQSAISFLRRSRGYAPDAIALADEGPEVMGCGADLKNTFTLTKGKFAIVSQHIGDMENYETIRFFEECFENLKQVYRVNPIAIVNDLHPGYLSTQWAIECGVRNAECGMKTFGIQHHYAHIGSVMAEHGITDKVIGVAFDGTGYGTDGNLWGGEFVVADIDDFERAGQFKYIALPGGESAIREPWKTAVSYILDAAGDRAGDYLNKTGFLKKYGSETLEKVMMVARSRELSPLASGAGRLFDAVSALIGLCDRNTFEGEAAMTLESFTREGIEEEYPVEFMREKGYTVVNFSPAIIAMIDDISQAVGNNIIATKFHNTVCSVIRSMVRYLSNHHKITKVALSGGTFQNLYLLNRTVRLLSSDGMEVFINQKVPCNDGGISLGQAYLVRERLKKFGVQSSEFGVQDERDA